LSLLRKELKMPKGLYNKYVIAHSDGTPLTPGAKYFVLRYTGSDKHAKACRAALRVYAKEIASTLPELSQDLWDAIAELENS
jgi:hypothetical protein